MSKSFTLSGTPDEALARLRAGCGPYTPARRFLRDTRLCRIRGSRVLLWANGAMGRVRPKRVFRATLRALNGQTRLTGRFGLCLTDRLTIGLPTALLLALAVWLTPGRTPLAVGVIWFSLLLCGFVLCGFTLYMSTVVNRDTEDALLDWLARDLPEAPPDEALSANGPAEDSEE